MWTRLQGLGVVYPENPVNHAKAIRRNVDNCPHRRTKEEGEDHDA
jgi:hypothetical protein